MLDKIKAFFAAVKKPWDVVTGYVGLYPQIATTIAVVAVVVAIRYF